MQCEPMPCAVRNRRNNLHQSRSFDADYSCWKRPGRAGSCSRLGVDFDTVRCRGGQVGRNAATRIEPEAQSSFDDGRLGQGVTGARG